MEFETTFMKCKICGNVIGIIDNSGVTPHCCGQEMTVLKANTEDAAQEKHVPFVERQGNILNVQVGSTLHPMTEEHHISWIAVVQNGKTQIAKLNHTAEPKAKFCVDDGDLSVYEYCNLHGLWVAHA